VVFSLPPPLLISERGVGLYRRGASPTPASLPTPLYDLQNPLLLVVEIFFVVRASVSRRGRWGPCFPWAWCEKKIMHPKNS